MIIRGFLRRKHNGKVGNIQTQQVSWSLLELAVCFLYFFHLSCKHPPLEVLSIILFPELEEELLATN